VPHRGQLQPSKTNTFNYPKLLKLKLVLMSSLVVSSFELFRSLKCSKHVSFSGLKQFETNLKLFCIVNAC